MAAMAANLIAVEARTAYCFAVLVHVCTIFANHAAALDAIVIARIVPRKYLPAIVAGEKQLAITFFTV
jgi:hypothetical protein